MLASTYKPQNLGCGGGQENQEFKDIFHYVVIQGQLGLHENVPGNTPSKNQSKLSLRSERK